MYRNPVLTLLIFNWNNDFKFSAAIDIQYASLGFLDQVRQSTTVP